MTVSISRMDIRYYLSTIASADNAGNRGQLTGYYTASGDPKGRWYGSGLQALNLTQESYVSEYAAIAIYEEARNPNNGKQLGKAPIKETAAPEGAKTAAGRGTSKKRKPVAGFDLTFSTPKSVSVLWAIADNSTQARIHAAHQEAVRKTLTWAEQNVIQTRAGDGGVVRVAANGIIASLFDHFDSRAGDPQLHTHAVIANRVQRASDGAWVTLDSYGLHKAVVTISEMYNNVLFDELAQRVQAEAEQRDPLMKVLKDMDVPERNRRMELAGVPDELIAEFSQRTLSIEAIKDDLVREWELTNGKKAPEELVLKFREKATLKSREDKPATKLPLSERMAQWHTRTIRNGYLPTDIINEAAGRNITHYNRADFTDKAITEIANEILARTVPKHPTFTRYNLLASAHRLTANLRFNSLEERDQFANELTDRALTATIELTPDRYDLPELTQEGLALRGTSVFDRAEEKQYTTAEVLSQEADLMAGVTAHTTPTYAKDSDQAMADLKTHTSDDGHHLAPDQLMAAHAVITSDKSISAIIGPAGTGKTSTLAGLRTAWEAQHGKDSIIGLAPSAAAASVLGKELGISTENTAKWIYESVGEGAMRRAEQYASLKNKIASLEQNLAHNPKHTPTLTALDSARTKLTTLIGTQSKFNIKPGQLLIVDEASMSSTEDLYKLHQQVKAVGAKMLLVGDPRQLDAVDAGGILGWIENKNHAQHLTSVWRFKADWEKEASLQLRLGDTDVLKKYLDNDRITTADNALDSAYKAWLIDRDLGKTSVLIAGSNASVLELNNRAQADLMESGKLDSTTPITISTGTAYPGDTVLARLNNRHLTDENGDFIKNGTRLIITSATASSINAVREDTGAPISIPKAYAETSIELGYACTIHRSQGLTVDTCHVAISTEYNREQLYVAMTRGKQKNQMHVEKPDPEQEDGPDQWGIMRRIEPEEVLELLSGIIHKSDVDKTAHEVRDAEHGWANDLGRALSELDYLADLSATRRVHSWLTATGRSPEDYVQTPDYKALVLAAKESTIDLTDLPTEVETVQAATDYLKAHHETHPLELIPTLRFASADETVAEQAITSRISQRVDTILHTHQEEPWATQLRREHPLDYQVHKQVVLWRAISKQEDATTYLGQKPRESSLRLSNYYKRINEVITNLSEQHSEQVLWNPEVDTLGLTEEDWEFLDMFEQAENDPSVAEFERIMQTLDAEASPSGPDLP